MVELLAPAGNFESLAAAIKAGCDSVYFGIDHLNMRASGANNFSLNQLASISRLCHKHYVKCYITLNTVVFDYEEQVIDKILKKVVDTKIDAVIASDFLVIQKALDLGVEVHISTQLSISNYESVRFCSKYADRIVLARELTLPMISTIKSRILKENLKGPNGRILEIEAFCHGALCIAVSGRCFMSLFEFNASANRGVCRQSCRRSYDIIDKETNNKLSIENEYVMSPEDLCTIKFIDKFIEAGIDCLKIEGRARAVDYVYTTVKCYREALDAIKENKYNESVKDRLYDELKKVYNRGFSDGFYMGVPLGSWAKVYGSKATEKKILIGKVLNYYKKNKVAHVLIESNNLRKGQTIGFSGPKTGFIKQGVSKIMIDGVEVDKATKKQSPTIAINEEVRKNDKVYLFESLL